MGNLVKISIFQMGQEKWAIAVNRDRKFGGTVPKKHFFIN